VLACSWGVFAPLSEEHQHVSQRPTLGAHHCSLGARETWELHYDPHRRPDGRIALVFGAPLLPSTTVRYTTYSSGQAVTGERNAVTLPSLPRWRGGAECCPLLYEPASLFEHVGSPIGLLDFIANDMGQRRLNNLILERRALARPSGAGGIRRNSIGLLAL
jgi:hypothetical protein